MFSTFARAAFGRRRRIGTPLGRAASLLAAILSVTPTVAAQATQPTQATQPSVAVTLGFGGVFKADAWTPVYVRVADDAPRPATIDLRTTHGKAGHVVEARVYTSASPTTYTLYAPPLGMTDGITLQLRDAAGRPLRQADLTDAARATPAALGGPAFGVGGSTATAQRVAAQLMRDTEEQVAAGATPTSLLPDRAIGYQAIDVLVLPELNTDTLDDGIEDAIVRWVRSGGVVVAWPGGQVSVTASPLHDLLPAEIGDYAEHSIAGRTIIARALTPTAGSRELSPGDASIYERRLGLGQVVLCSFDPTTLPGGHATDRVELWRRLTSGQLHLLASERRNGLFDPLVAQARGEQHLVAPAQPTSLRPWLLAGLLLSLAMGPGELLLLAAAGRHPRTPVTVVGLLGTVACAVTLVAHRPSTAVASARHDTLVIETDDGWCATATHDATLPSNVPQTMWLAGDRLDPAHQPAGELSLGLRADEGFAIESSSLIELSPATPLTLRSTDLPELNAAAPTGIVVQPDGTVRRSSGEAWTELAAVSPSAFAVVRTDGVDAIQPPALPTTSPSVGAIGRRKTGVEQLAERDEWAPVLMDRALANRLVQLQEFENATLYIARIELPQETRFVVHVSRR